MKKYLLVVLSILLFGASSLVAEVKELRFSRHYGLAYLPLIVLEDKQLIEKNAKAAGLGDITVRWTTFGGGAQSNDALLSGSIDVVAYGIAPFIRVWDKTKGRVKSIGAVDQTPYFFNTSNPKVKSIRDLTQNDRIAVPAIKVSVQSLILQIAAAKEFGIDQYDKLDHLTVSLKHPDAYIALTSGKSEITGHISYDPYHTLELQDPNIHTVFNSYDIFNGNHASSIVATTQAFYDNNPTLIDVIIKSLDEANEWITNNKEEAAKSYLKISKSKEPLELIVKSLNNPGVVYSTTPQRSSIFSDFLYQTGAIKTKPESWKDLFFEKLHSKPGS
ncbi:MAG: ABC transporter substrate-binding protein [Campylobacteraceae bacterium]